MTETFVTTTRPLPSSILHNGTEVRRQHTRAAARKLAGFLRRKIRRINRKATEVAQYMPQVQGGH